MLVDRIRAWAARLPVDGIYVHDLPPIDDYAHRGEAFAIRHYIYHACAAGLIKVAYPTRDGRVIGMYLTPIA